MIAHNQPQTKAVVTVAEMARMVGLSRARFYQLQGTAFPWPVYDVSTRRPFYVEEQQRICLEVRRRNCGIDGKPILFYARRNDSMSLPAAKPRTLKPKVKVDPHADLIESLRSLGLTTVTSAQVASVVKQVFPNGVSGIDPSEVIRTVFVSLKRQNSGDNLGR